MNYNNHNQPPVSKKAKTSAVTTNNKVSLKCSHCDFSTKTQARKTATINLIKHMQQSTLCSHFLKHCPNIKCQFVCIEDNAITRHLSHKASCSSVYHATAATQREIMAISNSAVYTSNDICNRDPHLSKRHFNNIMVQNQGIIVDKPMMHISELPHRANKECVSTLTHRMMATNV